MFTLYYSSLLSVKWHYIFKNIPTLIEKQLITEKCSPLSKPSVELESFQWGAREGDPALMLMLLTGPGGGC